MNSLIVRKISLRFFATVIFKKMSARLKRTTFGQNLLLDKYDFIHFILI